MIQPIRGQHRITTTILSSGQPRAYADSATVVRLTFEHVPWVGALGWMSWSVTEDTAKTAARGALAGYIDKLKKDRTHPFQSYLAYFKPTQEQMALQDKKTWTDKDRFSEWEFKVITPFTD